MIIFKDLITNDELFTDSNKLNLVDDCLYEVLCTHVTRRQGEIVLAGSNPSAEEEGGDGGTDEAVESGLDLVLNQKLMPTSFDKKSYIQYLKSYTKTLAAKWKELEFSEEKQNEYKEKLTAAAKLILPKLNNEPEFYLGENCNPDGMVAILEYRDTPEGEKAYMLFFKHGLEAEKV